MKPYKFGSKYARKLQALRLYSFDASAKCKESHRWMKYDLVAMVDISCLFEKGIKLLRKINWHTLGKLSHQVLHNCPIKYCTIQNTAKSLSHQVLHNCPIKYCTIQNTAKSLSHQVPHNCTIKYCTIVPSSTAQFKTLQSNCPIKYCTIQNTAK
jgi:hypothetical protein